MRRGSAAVERACLGQHEGADAGRRDPPRGLRRAGGRTRSGRASQAPRCVPAPIITVSNTRSPKGSVSTLKPAVVRTERRRSRTGSVTS